MTEVKKQTLGRRRIEYKIIENRAAREVTFSKRHQGMFRKAGELAILCGAEVAIIAYSPHGNPFVFGHPSVDAVLNRYNSGGTGTQASEAAVAAPSILTLDKCRKQYQDAVSDLEEARRVEIQAGKRRVAGDCYGQRWWNEHIDDVMGMGMEELEHYVASLENLMNKVADKINILSGI